MRVVNMETAIDQNLIKGSMLSIKQLALLMGITTDRLYMINNGKTKIKQEEIDTLEYINSKLEELANEMREW